MAQQNRLMEFNTLADAFLPVKDEATDKAISEARATIGDADWKKGYSKEKRDVVRAALKENGAHYETEISGKLVGVDHKETKNNDVAFNKLRVTLESDQGRTVLTADMKSEFAQRLVSKLDTAVQEHAGADVKIGGFASEKEKDGRTFVDHVATLKGPDGQEIKANPIHFGKASELAAAAQEPMKALASDKKVLNDIAKSVREKYFTEVTEGLHNRMVEQGIAPTQQEQKGPYPGHEAHLKSEVGEDKWYSLKMYANKDGELLASLQVSEEKNLKSRESNLAVKTGKDGTLVVRGEGVSAKVDADRKVQFFEGKEQVRGALNPSLKPNDAAKSLPAGKDRTAEVLSARLGQGKGQNVGKEV